MNVYAVYKLLSRYSIWGLYNRYSPHNIKKSCDADYSFGHAKNQQQG